MNSESLIVNDYQKTAKAMSQAAIGRVLGLAPSTMTKYKLAGMPMDSVESARAWHKAHTNIAQRKHRSAPTAAANLSAEAQSQVRPTASTSTNPSAAARPDYGRVGGDDFHAMIRAHEVRADGYALMEDFDAARTREKIATANLAEIEEAALRGMYLVKTDFERYLFNAGRMLRDTLANCARRIGAEVSGLTTAEACEAVIDREHRAALASFAQLLRHTLKIEVEANPLNAPTEPHA